MPEQESNEVLYDATGREFRMEVIDDATAEKYRKMTFAERLANMDRLNRELRAKTVSEVRSEHPEFDEVQVQREATRRIVAMHED
ncbi:MAG: hypothetical protein U0640_14900 [Phycisphaerales bacterium]